MNNLREGGITIHREGDDKMVFEAENAVSKRYLKYLTKKFLKKHQLRDWLRVVSEKDGYIVKYFKVAQDEEGEEEED